MLDESYGRFYDREEEIKMIYEGAIDLAKRRSYAEGTEAGILQGIKQNKCEMVINLNNLGVSLDIISKASGLSQEEIEEIINNSKKSK